MIEAESLMRNATVVRAGDRLVVAINRALSPDQCRVAAHQIGELLPGVDVTVIDSVATMVVYPADPLRQPARCIYCSADPGEEHTERCQRAHRQRTGGR